MSAIEWTGETWNPTTGCDRVSPGCDNCYALTMAKRLKAMGQPKYQNDGDPRTSGPGFGLTVHPDTLDVPLRRKKPTTYFVNSMSDLFHPDVPAVFINDVLAVMALAPQHTFQILTKRPQRMATDLAVDGSMQMWLHERIDARAPYGEHPLRYPSLPLSNVWLGTSIESDRYAFRADHLRATPAAVRFLSLEPLLGPLPPLDLTDIDWVIIGGESGRGARPLDLGWVRDLIAQARDAGSAVFVKQLGRSFDGRKGNDIDAWPADLRVREFPSTPRASLSASSEET